MLQLRILDADSLPLPSAIGLVYAANDTTLVLAQGISDPNGLLTIRQIPISNVSVRVQMLGYSPEWKTFSLQSGRNEGGNIVLQTVAELLRAATVSTTQERVTLKGDTTEINAEAYKVNPDADAADLVRKMPGIEIQGGTVRAQGEDVKRVTVDGKEFFGEDANVALRALPADVISKIQVYDRLSDQSRFTGFDDGNTEKTLNIITKPGTNKGQFGRVYAGGGKDNRYQAGGNVNFFQGKRRIALIGLSNNINQQNFNSQDVLSVTGGSGGRRGGRGGRPGFGAGESFTVPQQPGINATHSLGINYSDEWGSRVKVTGSYFGSFVQNQNDAFTNRQFFLRDQSLRFYTEERYSSSNDMNHRIQMRITMELDSSNTLILTPNISLQSNRSNAEILGVNAIEAFPRNVFLNSTNTFNDNTTLGYNFRNSILWQRKLNKKGRTLSVDLRTDVSDRVGQFNLLAENVFGVEDSVVFRNQQQESVIDAQNISTSIRYTEPLGEKNALEISYEPSFRWSSSLQLTEALDPVFGNFVEDLALSNEFDNLIISQNAGLSFRRNGEKYNFFIGGEFQDLQLLSNQVFPETLEVNKRFQNLLPRGFFRYQFSKQTQLRTFYRARTITPSVQQLQNVADNSNPLLLSAGNPNLGQAVNHFNVIRFNHTNTEKGTTFFGFMTTQITQNFIGNATFIAPTDSLLASGILLPAGAQLNTPENLGTAYAMRSYLTYGIPLLKLKSNINFNGGLSWQQSPGLLNNARNVSDYYNFSGGLVWGSNISKEVDFTISYSGQYNIVNNSIQPQLDNNYYTHIVGATSQFALFKNWVLQTDANHYTFTGLGDGFNQQFLLLNAGIGYKFLKNQSAEFRLTVFDLLKQNNSIIRDVNETFIEDRRISVLQRFFMLTFTYNLRNFNQPKPDENATNYPPRMGGRPPGVLGG